MIDWMSKKHKSVDLITVEAEYMDASMASCEAILMINLFRELFE